MVIITGASDGLGLALAKLIVSKGKRAISISRTKPEDGRVEWIKTDLLDDESIRQAVQSIESEDYTISSLINCAAITSYEDIDSITEPELNKMFQVNVLAPILLTSKLLGKIKKDEADILNIGATIALKSGYENQSVYSATKWALRGFTQNLSDSLKSTNCRVSNIFLGGFNSKMHQKVTGEAIRDPENWMRVEDIAEQIYHIMNTPKSMEVSEIVINRKARRS